MLISASPTRTCLLYTSILDNIDTKERETKAFTKLKNFIPDITCLLITNSEEAVLECNYSVIDVVPAWKWLLDAADTSSH